jgi:hypothetical protein
MPTDGDSGARDNASTAGVDPPEGESQRDDKLRRDQQLEPPQVGAKREAQGRAE